MRIVDFGLRIDESDAVFNPQSEIRRSAICLFFAALHLHFRFERDGEVKDAGLVYRLDEA